MNRREGPSREAVEVALRGLDRADLAAARWIRAPTEGMRGLFKGTAG